MSYEDGIELYKKGNYKQALNIFLKINDFLYIGLCHLSLWNYSASINAFSEVLNNPDLKDKARYYRGLAYYRWGKLRPALKEFEYVCGEYEALANLHCGNICYRLKELAKAMKYYRKVLTLKCEENIHQEAKRILSSYLIDNNEFDELLSMYEGKIDDFDECDETLLMRAVDHESRSLIDKLIELKADPFKENKDGKSAFSICDNGHLLYLLIKNYLNYEQKLIILDCKNLREIFFHLKTFQLEIFDKIACIGQKYFEDYLSDSFTKK